MSITVKKIASQNHEHEPTPNAPGFTDHYLDLVGQVGIDCQVRIGTLTLTIHQLRQLKQGQTLTLHQKTDEPVEILVNQHVIARGDLMTCEDHFAIRITELSA